MPNASELGQSGQATSGSISTMEIDKILSSVNLAPYLDPTLLSRMGMKVIEEYDIDKLSRKDWETTNEQAIKLATQVVEKKNQPFEGASNIKFPTLSLASVQFAARAYPQLFKGTDIVKCRVIGKDEGGKKAGVSMNISQHMSYQILEEMDEWEDDTDSLLVALPIEGCEFKKTYYSPSLKRNVSDWVRPSDLVVNFWARNLRVAPRATHVLRLYPSQIAERVRTGLFLDIPELYGKPQLKDEADKYDVRDDSAPHTFYEQHRYWDIDRDGYSEPVIVTVHRDSQRVVRVMPRYDIRGIVSTPPQEGQRPKIIHVKPVHYFTRFLFMPCPEGGIYGQGFGKLLGPINTSINMTINQLHDAGSLANTQGGFVGKGFTPGKGRQPQDLEFEMGEFKQVNYSGDDIRKAIMPLPFKGPDATLFQLLGMLVESGDKLGSVTDPMLGQSPGTNVPATTTLALIEQGGKVFSSVFKRLFRSFKKEFTKLYRLNGLYLEDEQYYMIMDSPTAIKQQDYNLENMDVIPCADPNMVSETQLLLKAEILKGFMGMGLDDGAIMRFCLEAMRIPDFERFIPKEPKEQEPDPKTVAKLMELDLKQQELDLKSFEAEAKVVKLHADSILALAKAEAAELGPQIELYKTQMAALTERFKARAQKESKSATKSGTGK